jgi:hypothetical protein
MVTKTITAAIDDTPHMYTAEIGLHVDDDGTVVAELRALWIQPWNELSWGHDCPREVPLPVLRVLAPKMQKRIEDEVAEACALKAEEIEREEQRRSDDETADLAGRVSREGC